MNTKLTLRLDDTLINKAKKYAKKEGKSISQIVAEFFTAINSKSYNVKDKKLKPITSKLYKSLKNSKISKDDYKTYLESKYL